LHHRCSVKPQGPSDVPGEAGHTDTHVAGVSKKGKNWSKNTYEKSRKGWTKTTDQPSINIRKHVFRLLLSLEMVLFFHPREAKRKLKTQTSTEPAPWCHARSMRQGETGLLRRWKNAEPAFKCLPHMCINTIRDPPFTHKIAVENNITKMLQDKIKRSS